MSQAEKVSLASLAEGAAGELFDAELERVLENIADPNTRASAKRAIVLTVTIAPDETRQAAPFSIGVMVKLAPTRPHASTMYFGSEYGRPVAKMVDPGQRNLFETPPQAGVHSLPTPSTGSAP